MFIADALSGFAAELSFESVPALVRVRAKHLLLDAIGIAFASGKYEFARRALMGISQFGEGDSDVIGMGARLPLRDAVLMNGTLVHGLDYDDTYLPGSIHLSATSVPAALGMAAHLDASGRELLTACIVGMETGARLSLAGQGQIHRAGFHPTSVCGAFSSAIVAGRLMKLSVQHLTMAQGIALATASGTVQPMQDGSWTKRMHPGWAAAAGITSAGMAGAGYTGPQAAYEGRFGFYNVFLGQWAQDADQDLVTAGLGDHWEFPRASIKLYPACHHVHAFANAAIQLRREHGIDAAAVESVHTLVAGVAIPLVCEPAHEKCRPQSSYIAQFSLQYAVACALARGRFGLTEIEEDSYSDPDLVELAQKVSYELDPDSGFPKLRSGEVIVRMKDGRVLRCRENILPEEPASNEAIVTKFMDNAQLVMSESRAAQIRNMILAIEEELHSQRISRVLGTAECSFPASAQA